MPETKSKKAEWIIKHPMWAILIAACIIALLQALYFCIVYHVIDGMDLSKTGTFGDTFGVFAAFFTGLAFVGLAVSILIQRSELSAQKEELAATRQVFLRESFDNKFFKMLELLKQRIDQLSYSSDYLRDSGEPPLRGYEALSGYESNIWGAIEHINKNPDQYEGIHTENSLVVERLRKLNAQCDFQLTRLVELFLETVKLIRDTDFALQYPEYEKEPDKLSKERGRYVNLLKIQGSQGLQGLLAVYLITKKDPKLDSQIKELEGLIMAKYTSNSLYFKDWKVVATK